MVVTWIKNEAVKDTEEEDEKERLEYQYSRNHSTSRDLVTLGELSSTNKILHTVVREAA